MELQELDWARGAGCPDLHEIGKLRTGLQVQSSHATTA